MPPPTAGASPVCRFYLPPAYGDSHFYSAAAAECAQVAAALSRVLVRVAGGVPHRLAGLRRRGACASGTVPVYRMWDNRSDTNHRYTTSATVRQQMLAQGWVAEGYGPDQVIMCAPVPG